MKLPSVQFSLFARYFLTLKSNNLLQCFVVKRPQCHLTRLLESTVGLLYKTDRHEKLLPETGTALLLSRDCLQLTYKITTQKTPVYVAILIPFQKHLIMLLLNYIRSRPKLKMKSKMKCILSTYIRYFTTMAAYSRVRLNCLTNGPIQTGTLAYSKMVCVPYLSPSSLKAQSPKMRSLKRYRGGNGGTTSLSRSLAAVTAMLLSSSDELPSSASWTSAISAAARLQGRDLPRTNRILTSVTFRRQTTTSTAYSQVGLVGTTTRWTRKSERLQWIPANATVSPRGLPASDADPTS